MAAESAKRPSARAHTRRESAGRPYARAHRRDPGGRRRASRRPAPRTERSCVIEPSCTRCHIVTHLSCSERSVLCDTKTDSERPSWRRGDTGEPERFSGLGAARAIRRLVRCVAGRAWAVPRGPRGLGPVAVRSRRRSWWAFGGLGVLGILRVGVMGGGRRSARPLPTRLGCGLYVALRFLMGDIQREESWILRWRAA